MATVKATFTLDPASVSKLRDAAERLSRPKSEVVREAIHDFHQRIGRLSERERLRLLRAFDELVPTIPSRPRASVNREIADIRRARRAAGARSAPRRAR